MNEERAEAIRFLLSNSIFREVLERAIGYGFPREEVTTG